MAAIIRNKTLYVLSEDDGLSYEPFNTVNEEVFLTADINSMIFDYEHYCRAIASPASQKIFRLYLLNDDETIRSDVSEYVTQSTATFNHQQGQTRECSVTIINDDGFWEINPIQRVMWRGVKYRLDTGIYYDGTAYWKRCGVFTPSEPSYNMDAETISVQMFDKFALLDGTLGGKQPYKIKIPVGTKLKTAIRLLLSMERNTGVAYDSKDFIFPSEYEDYELPYTINQNEDISIGEIIIELATMISCDVFYNDFGNLVIANGVDTLSYKTKPILWHYHTNELQYANASVDIKFKEFVNKVIVRGAIENGKQFYGEAINTNPKSQTSVALNDTYTYQMTDSKINSDKLCSDRARYELKNKTILGAQVKYKSIFIPHLVQNEFVKWDNEKLNIYNKRFVIKGISIDLTDSMLMDISLCNVDEICL